MDAAGVLAGWWSPSEDELAEDEELRETLAPFGGRFPGLAPAAEEELDPELMREDRSGARLLEAGFDAIRLLVSRPPRTLEAAQPIAAEHFASATMPTRACAGCLRSRGP